MKKKYINAQSLLDDSFKLAIKIIESGYTPDLIVGIWRGGTPIAIAIQEAFEFIGISTDHIAIRTTSYTGIGTRSTVKVDGLDYLKQKLSQNTTILLIDDVFDTGLSIQQTINEIEIFSPGQQSRLKIATPYFKPDNNKSFHQPDFYLYETAEWLVFPHELQGLSEDELLKLKPGNEVLIKDLLNLRRK